MKRGLKAGLKNLIRGTNTHLLARAGASSYWVALWAMFSRPLIISLHYWYRSCSRLCSKQLMILHNTMFLRREVVRIVIWVKTQREIAYYPASNVSIIMNQLIGR